MKGSFRQFNKCIATRRPPQGRTRRPDCEWPRNYWGSHNTVTIMRVGRDPPHILVTETVTVFRRDSIAGAVLASAELCRRSTADRLYERARAAMPGQGSIERLKLRSTRTPRPFANEHWILGSVAVSKALWGRGRFLPTHRMPPATHPALVLAGILFSGMFGSGVNPDSSIEVHQVAGRESSSQILHVSVRA